MSCVVRNAPGDMTDPIEVDCVLAERLAHDAGCAALSPRSPCALSPLSRQQPSLAQTLTGTVSSAAEGAMEGVLVSAQKAGSPITVTVVSDALGRFRFPDGRLSPGHYTLRIRAVGYDLAGPASGRARRRRRPMSRSSCSQDRRPRRATHQYRMAHEHARHGRAEAAADGVHELPHAATDRPFDLHRRTVRARAGSAWRITPTIRSKPGCKCASPPVKINDGRCRQARRLSGDDKSQQRAGLELRIANPAAAQGTRHSCRHHRVRSAAPDDRAA